MNDSEHQRLSLQNDLDVLRSLLDSIPQIVWTGDAEGSVEYFNKRWFEYTGMTAEESMGWAWQPVIHEDDLPLCLQRWTNSIKTGAPYEVEYRMRRADNTYHWHLGRATAVKDEKGQTVKWFGTSTNIDDQKQLEQSLEKRVQERMAEQEALHERILSSERRFRVLFDQTFQLIGLLSPSGILLEANQTALDFLKIDRDKIIGKQFWDTPYWSHSAVLQEKLKKAVADAAAGKFVRFETEHFGAEGRKDVDFSLKPVTREGLTVMLIAEGRDITERKEAERAAVEQAELLDLSHDSIIVRSLDGTINFWNKGAEAEYGFLKEEALGQISHQLLKTKFPQALDEIDRDLVERGRWEGELIHCTKNGQSIVVASRWALHTTERGNKQVFEINNDITSRKKAEEKAKELTKELARSNKDLEQFAYAASHDLQEPLRTVTSFSDLLNKKLSGKLDEDAERYLEVIVESTQRMQQLVKDLLVYAKLDSQKKELEAIDLEGPLLIALSLLRAAVAESKAEITHEKLPTVMANPSQISLVFQNLVSNALKFSGPEKVKINIAAEDCDEFWKISVRDNGIGLDMTYAERIFVLFQRLHSRSKYQGTGIGLALCKRIIESHGGSIGVQSAPDKGSTFFFTLRKGGSFKQ